MESDSSRDSFEGAINEERIYGPPSDTLPSLPFAMVPFVQTWSHLHQPNKPEPDSFYDMYSRTLVIQKGLFFYIFKSPQIEPVNYPVCMQIQMGKPVSNVVAVSVASTFRTLALQTSSLLVILCTLEPTNRVTETRLEQSPSKREILGLSFINHLQANLLVITRIGFDLFFYKEDVCEIIPIKSFSMPNTQLYWYELQTNTVLLNCTMAKDTVIPFFLNRDPEKFKNVKGDRIILGELKEESTIYKAFRFFQKTESSMISPIPLRQPIYNRNLKFAKDQVEDDFRRAMSRLAPFPHQLVLATVYLDIVILYFDPDMQRVYVYRLDVDKNQRERYSIKVQKKCKALVRLAIIALQVSENLIIVHNVTKKYSEFYDINGEKLNKSITCKGKIVSEGYGVDNSFHPYTPRLLFLENDVVLDPENKKAYWYIFNVSTLIELCKSPVELLFHLIRRTNLKEFILQTILRTIDEQISLGKISKVFSKISQIYRKATIERNMRKKLQQEGGSNIQVEKPVHRLSTFQNNTTRASSIRISSEVPVEAVSEEGKADSRFSMRGREEAEKKVGLTNSGEIIIYLTEMNSEIFQKIVWSDLPTDYVLACLLESQRSVLANQIPSVPAHQTLLIKFLVRRREYETLVKLIQLKIIKDTASLAQLLKELGAPRRLKTGIEENDPLGFYHGAFQLGIDIYHRLRRFDKIYEAFVENSMIYDAIDYAERMKELTGLPFRGLVEVAKLLTDAPIRRRVGRRLASLKKVRVIKQQRHEGKDYKFLFEGGDERELRGLLQIV